MTTLKADVTEERVREMLAHAVRNRAQYIVGSFVWDSINDDVRILTELLSLRERVRGDEAGGHHKLDTDAQVFFYERDFYVLSNFSAFNLRWRGQHFYTSEAAYHWEKFPDNPLIRASIWMAPSAHEAFKVAEREKAHRRRDWDDVKVDIMRHILHAKAEQHEYVRRKLLATGDRELVEDSWRDDFWGWGPNRDGQNMLGKLWMEVRAELRAALSNSGGGENA